MEDSGITGGQNSLSYICRNWEPLALSVAMSGTIMVSYRQRAEGGAEAKGSIPGGPINSPQDRTKGCIWPNTLIESSEPIPAPNERHTSCPTAAERTVLRLNV
ncbi:hypothetical protein KM043_012449 [Ampulex compressa]|nr:hypothetical protein KM043_012449 [Ampulex compressa]